MKSMSKTRKEIIKVSGGRTNLMMIENARNG